MVSVQLMLNMLSSATAFDQDLSEWEVGVIINASGMFDTISMSVIRCDRLLIGWSLQALQAGVNFSAGSSSYFLAEAARALMVSSDGWTIS